jgi:hypothetical protein
MLLVTEPLLAKSKWNPGMAFYRSADHVVAASTLKRMKGTMA